MSSMEDHLRALMRHSFDVLVVVDDQARLLRPAANRILGYPEGSLTGRNTLELVHPDERVEARGALARAVSSEGVPIRLQTRLLHADGGWRRFELVLTGRRADPSIGGVVVNGQDVTERLAAQQALDATEELARSVLEAVPGPSAVLDPSGRIVMVNRAWIEQSTEAGYFDAESWAGLDYVALWEHADEGAFADGERIAAGVRAVLGGERKALREDLRVPGSGRWIELSVSPLGAGRGAVLLHTDITARKDREADLSTQAHTDSLTGLANRTLLSDHLEITVRRARRTGRPVAVLFVDLDRFKVVNDAAGHEAGDDLLAAVAARIQGVVRAGDTVARFGGDEFVVVAEVGRERDAIDAAERILSALEQPFDLDGHPLVVSASIGIAVAAGPALDPGALLRDADAAMYRAKALGPGRLAVFDLSMRVRALERLDGERQLQRALADDELFVEYQPVCRADGAVTSVEALVRWRHPGRGRVEPGEFIDLAEETGLIVPIGRKVLDEACRQLADWRAAYPAAAGVTVSVNVSALQLARPAFGDEVADAIARHGLDPGDVCLEITESLFVAVADTAARSLADLHARGVRLAVDDFGTGYSSLLYLRRFPIDALKLDRAFVGGLDLTSTDRGIVDAFIRLAHSLGLEAVAEGVETAQQLRALGDLGCNLTQGFLWSRPVPPAGIEHLFAGGATPRLTPGSVLAARTS
jgi:diguanylate cyclase (GGDEF)-like protein/PAS domain S-box-containing protein